MNHTVPTSDRKPFAKSFLPHESHCSHIGQETFRLQCPAPMNRMVSNPDRKPFAYSFLPP